MGCYRSHEDTYYYHTDHLGSSNVVTDGAGNVVREIYYMPYGATNTVSGSIDVRHRFTGQELDDETGLYYYGARYYDPAIGRFISADTIVPNFADPQSLNRYSYVDSVGKPLTESNPYLYTGNSPINRIDPFGLAWLEFDRGLGLLYVHPGGMMDFAGPLHAFPAANNTDSSSRGPWAFGTYVFSGWSDHAGEGVDSAYGTQGVFVFRVPGCRGCGVHAGRQNKCDKAKRCGVQHATMGCIRTTEDAVALVRRLARNSDPVLYLKVR